MECREYWHPQHNSSWEGQTAPVRALAKGKWHHRFKINNAFNCFAGNLESSPWVLVQVVLGQNTQGIQWRKKEIYLSLLDLKKTQTGKTIADFMDKNSCIS